MEGLDYVKSILPFIGNITHFEIHSDDTPYHIASIKNSHHYHENHYFTDLKEFNRNRHQYSYENHNEYHFILKDDSGNQIWLSNMFGGTSETKHILNVLGLRDYFNLKHRDHPYVFTNLKPNHDINLLIPDETDHPRFIFNLGCDKASHRFNFLYDLKFYAYTNGLVYNFDYKGLEPYFPTNTTNIDVDCNDYAMNFSCKPRFFIDSAEDLVGVIKDLSHKHELSFDYEEHIRESLPHEPSRKKKVSVSSLSNYFFTGCDRQLFLNSKTNKELEELNIKRTEANGIQQEAGNQWEQQIRSELIVKGHKVSDSTIDKHRDITYQLEKFLHQKKRLNLDKHNYYIYSSISTVPEEFYKEFKEENLPTIKPIEIDFIEISKDDVHDDQYNLRVIDAKSSEEIKPSQKIQVTLYTMILEKIIEHTPTLSHHFKIRNNKGGIWTKNNVKTYETFDLLPVKEVVHAFFNKELSDIINTDNQTYAQDLNYHIYRQCENCSFLKHCIKTTETDQHISRLHDLSPYTSRFLNSLDSSYIPNGQASSTLSTLQFLITENPELLAKNDSFFKRRDGLENEITSLNTNKIIPTNQKLVDMPKKEDNSVCITIEKDPISGSFFGQSLVVYSESFQLKKSFGPLIPESVELSYELNKEFVDEFHKIIQDIIYRKETFHLYFYTSYEKDLYIDLLLQIIQDATIEHSIKDKAKALLYLCYSHKLLEIGGPNTEEQLNDFVPYPYTIVQQAVQRLYALPIPFANTIKEVSQQFYEYLQGIVGYRTLIGAPIEDRNGLLSPLSGRVKIDALYSYWDGEKEKERELSKIKSILEAKQHALSLIVYSIKKLCGDRLVLDARFKTFPIETEYSNNLSEKLAFITNYESYIQLQDLVKQRQLPIEEQIHKGNVLHVKYKGEENNIAKFNILNDTGIKMYSPFNRWMILNDDEKGWVELNKIKDNTMSPLNPKEVNLSERCIYFKASKLPNQLKSNENYIFAPIYFNPMRKRTLKAIREFDNNPEESYLLLQDPNKYQQPINNSIDNDYWEEAKELVNFTDDQLNTFKHLVNNKLTLLWGPPGTGKTTFISLALVLFIKLYQEQDKGLNILVSAQTHTAIENCLAKIIDGLKKFITDLDLDQIGVCKLDGLKESKSDEIANAFPNFVNLEYQSRRNIYDDYQDFLEDYPISITGTTLSQQQKIKEKGYEVNYDLIIIDEASQVKLTEGLMATTKLHNSDSARLLLVGDHYQLPPVFKGDFQEKEPFSTHSLFSLLLEKHHIEPCQLSDNFRMNDYISSYSAKKIYNTDDKDYKAPERSIAEQTLDQSKIRKDPNSYTSKLLDPQAPLTLGITKGALARRDNEVEATIILETVKKLVCYYSGKPFKNQANINEDIWKGNRLFIVCPHKDQIQLVKEKLIANHIPLPNIGTVDKAQGQEAEVVIVSYGITDEELAEREADFLYSLKRLNVSMTRAMKKLILLIPDTLFKPNYSTLLEERNIHNYSFFLGIKNHLNYTAPSFHHISDRNITLEIYQ